MSKTRIANNRCFHVTCYLLAILLVLVIVMGLFLMRAYTYVIALQDDEHSATEEDRDDEESL